MILSKKCHVCGLDLSDEIISLPKLPLTELFFQEPTPIDPYLFDQSLFHCENCSHTQLGNILPPETLYYSSYFFSTSGSTTGKKANDKFLEFIKTNISSSKYINIVEFGCNDLYLLSQLCDYGENLVGVDPSLSDYVNNSLECNQIIKIGKLVEDIDLNEYIDCSKPTIIISSHTLEHLTNPVRLFQTFIHKFHGKCVCFFQFPIMEFILENLRFDQIFHQHVNYFSKRSIMYLVQRFGGKIFAESTNPHHWGTYMVAFSLSKTCELPTLDDPCKNLVTSSGIMEKYSEFSHQMQFVHDVLNKMVLDHPLIAYGAALMVPILSYHLSFDFSRFVMILDDDSKKHGLFYPGVTIPISSPENKIGYDNSCILISAVDNSRPILIKAITLNPYKIIIPFQQIS